MRQARICERWARICECRARICERWARICERWARICERRARICECRARIEQGLRLDGGFLGVCPEYGRQGSVLRGFDGVGKQTVSGGG